MNLDFRKAMNKMFYLFEQEPMIDPPREIVGVGPSKYTALQKKKALEWLRKGEHEELVKYYYALDKMRGKDAEAMKSLVVMVLKDPRRCEYCGYETNDPKCKFCGAKSEGRNNMNVQELNSNLLEAVGVLLEKVKCDTDCMEKYKTSQGRFKGKKGKKFKSCTKAFSSCCKGVKSAEGICANIARRKGLAPGS